MKSRIQQISFSTLLQDFFRKRLLDQTNASPQTIASYRDTFRLLLGYAQKNAKKAPSNLSLEDIDAPFVLAFLDHLEKDRKNSIRTRNARLAAIRAFMHYVLQREPSAMPNVQRVLAIPAKRFNRPLLGFLSREEMEAIIAAPDCSTWSGHRDHVMLTTFYNTGARVSEIIDLRIGDICLKGSINLTFHGKGRKERSLPIWKSTAKRFTEWLQQIDTDPTSPVFPNRNGEPLTRSGVEHRLRIAIDKAAEQCPSLKQKEISPHTLRHTTAMHLLQAGVDLTTIAMWLGHESPSTTHGYVEADMKMKERALKKLDNTSTKAIRYQASDPVLAFLDSL